MIISEIQYKDTKYQAGFVRYKGLPVYPTRNNRWNTSVWIKQNSSAIISVEEI